MLVAVNSPTGDQPGAPRSGFLADLAAAREAAAARSPLDVGAGPPESDGPDEAVSSGLLGIGITVGTGIFVAGMLTFGVLGTIGAALALGLAVTAFVMLFRRVSTVGRFALAALAGLFALVAGLVLGIRSYDEKYFGDRADRELWDLVSFVAFLLTAAGFLAYVTSLVGLLVAAILRSVRSS